MGNETKQEPWTSAKISPEEKETWKRIRGLEFLDISYPKTKKVSEEKQKPWIPANILPEKKG